MRNGSSNISSHPYKYSWLFQHFTCELYTEVAETRSTLMKVTSHPGCVFLRLCVKMCFRLGRNFICYLTVLKVGQRSTLNIRQRSTFFVSRPVNRPECLQNNILSPCCVHTQWPWTSAVKSEEHLRFWDPMHSRSGAEAPTLESSTQDSGVEFLRAQSI